MGEDVTEELEYVPARVYVKRHIRLKYVCRHCQGSIVQAPVHDHPINRCSVGVAFLAYIIVSKYGDHLPLYRLEQIFKRSQIDISRSNMSDWAMRLHRVVQPLIALMLRQILTSAVIHSDDTTLLVQLNGGAKRCYLWNYLGDHNAPYTYFDFREGRGRAGPNEILADYTGHLACDAYTGYEELFHINKDGHPQIIEVACWAHTRRYFVKAEDAGDKRAATPLDLIGQLYAVERKAKKDCAEKGVEQLHAHRQVLRKEHSAAIIKRLFEWIDNQLEAWPESPLGKALTYAQNQREALMRFAKDGRLEIDNNCAERAIRPVAVGRKNWLFAGGEQGGKAAATFFTLIESAKRNAVNPYEYLLDIFTRLPGHNIQELDDFLPDRWKKLRETGSEKS
jgi:transposase